MTKAAPEEFFARRDSSGALLEEKNHWLDAMPEDCLIETETTERFAIELSAMAKAWNQILPDTEESLESLSRAWEADLIFLDADTFVVAGG